MMKFMQKLQSVLWIASLTTILTACGGGGSSTVPIISSSASSQATNSSTNSSTISAISSGATTSSIANSDSSVSDSSADISSTTSNNSASSLSSTASSSTSTSRSSFGTVTAMTIHYKRALADYTGWGLHLFGSAISPSLVTQWASPHAFDGIQSGWEVAVIPVTNPAVSFKFVVHKGDFKSPAADIIFTPNTVGPNVWVVQDNDTPFFTLEEANVAAANIGNLSATLDTSIIAANNNASTLPDGWNKSANFMEIFVRAYKDSDGDGYGDLNGLISKLDYLQSLGVTGIWLMPVMKSFDHDHGYGVVDYRNLETDYGTLEDFDTLISEAHSRGIGVILDYVMNHSSNANPLFLDATTTSNNSKHNWFIFSDTDPNWTIWGNAAWHTSASGFYYGVFSSSLPDFNLKNSETVDYHLNNLRFWLNRGVDGFRFDAAGVLTENSSSQWNNQSQNHTVLKQAQDVINTYNNRFMICEAPDLPAAYAVTTSCENAFAFGYQTAIKSSATGHTLSSSLVSLLNSATKANMPLILSNHDSFAGDRPITELSGNNLGNYKVAAEITLLTSSTAFAYYGEEVGMANGAMSGDSNLRTPMSWTSNTTNAGFSTATPFRGLSANVATYNVQSQDGVSGSLLEHYKALYTVRKNYPVLGTGTLSLKSSAGDGALVFTRTDGSKQAAVLINLLTTPQTLTVNVGLNNTAFTQRLPSGSSTYTSNGSGVITVTNIPAQSAVVLVK